MVELRALNLLGKTLILFSGWEEKEKSSNVSGCVNDLKLPHWCS
jgi:hypothetical protein